MKRLALLGFLILAALPVNAQVAFSVYGGKAAAVANSTSLSFTLGSASGGSTITSGTNLVGRVNVALDDTAATSTVTWGGVSMTAACSIFRNGAVTVQTFLLAAPATGTPVVVITFSGGGGAGGSLAGNAHADAMTYTGVNQSTPARSGSCATSSGSTANGSVTITSQSGDMTGTCLASTNTITSTNKTSRSIDNTGSIIGFGTDDASGASSVTHNWTNSAGTWALAGFSIAQATAPPASTIAGPSKTSGPTRLD